MTSFFTCNEKLKGPRNPLRDPICDKRARYDHVDGYPTKCMVHSKAATEMRAEAKEKRAEQKRQKATLDRLALEDAETAHDLAGFPEKP